MMLYNRKGKAMATEVELVEEFIKIINANVTNKELIQGIKYLENSHVLNGTENSFCTKILEQLEMFSQLDYGLICKDLKVSNYHGEKIDSYNSEEFTNKLDEFIQNRKMEVFLKMINGSLEVGIENLTKELTQLFFERYSRVIEVKEDTDTFRKLENVDNSSEINYSSALELVDNLIFGLKGGTITSIVGGADNTKSLWAINIAYQAILQEKNVLYLSIGCSKQEVFKRLLTRHSCNPDKFEKEFCFDDDMTDYDINNYKIIYNDFKNNYLSNIIVYDESEFIISTHFNLQKLLINSQAQFIKKTGKTIDLVIIDDFSYMKLDVGNRCITNQDSVVNEYYNYLKDQSQNLLGSMKKIPIIITISPKQINRYFDSTSIYQAISNNVKILSDNIFISFSNKSLEITNQLMINIPQSYCKKILEQPKYVSVNYKYWYMEYNKDSKLSSKKLLEVKELENMAIKKELEETKEELNNSFNSTINDNLNITFD